MGKEFSWSFSKASSYEICPTRHYEVDIAKNFTDSTEQLDWGNTVHKGIAAAILHKAGLPAVGKGRDRVEPAELPAPLSVYQKWVDVVCAGKEDKLYVEEKYAITRDYKPTGWFDSDVWLRSICDLLALKDNTATALDWKTGKVKHDSRQLMLVATCVFAHYPSVEKVKTRFVWLKEDCTTFEEFKRDTIMGEWKGILELVARMEQAARDNVYEPTPNGLCARYCPVMSCQYHGKRKPR